ncbi:hypothetical protein DFP73DRAFT_597608 [Morchella snyderi]|nr:hypothetical protein DFP73DRAFT_597608 [Morchella snyderi]
MFRRLFLGLASSNEESKAEVDYLSMTLLGAGGRLGCRVNTIKAVPVQRMLRAANYALEGEDSILRPRKGHDRIVKYLIMEGYPTEANAYFEETNYPAIEEKDIVSTVSVTGGLEEFVTIGESWRMISYDGTFQMTNKMNVIFDGRRQIVMDE